MGKIEELRTQYERFASLPWPDHLAGAQRIWFAVYDRMDERRLRSRIEEFELATQRASHKWCLCDMTDVFADWITGHEYREKYFESPEDLDPAMPDFLGFAAEKLRAVLSESDSNTVVAVLGVAGLFGFIRVSELMDNVNDAIHGRLLVFFPGEYADNIYRLLDARDGWNYLAVPITAAERNK